MTASSPTLPEGSAIRVHKLRPDGTERFAWDGVVVHADESSVVVRAEFNVPLVDLGCTTLRQGDIFVEFYVRDRWYTVAQVWAADGTLKGWYCDVCVPPRWDAGGDLSYADLTLDLWCGADGAITLLDEEDFGEQRAAGVLTPAQAAGAERGWAELREVAERGELPRWEG